MRTIIFSDSHLTEKFDLLKFNFLTRIIELADKVVINGDFWDGYVTSFDRFVNSEWKKLFPLLKSKKTIYLYGNHDSSDLSDARVNLFSSFQDTSYFIKSGDFNFKIEHGHNFVQYSDKKWPLVLVRLITIFYNLNHFIKFRFQKKQLLELYRDLNINFKKRFTAENFLITGHTHGAEISLAKRFANSGFIQWGYGSYLVLEDGKLS